MKPGEGLQKGDSPLIEATHTRPTGGRLQREDKCAWRKSNYRNTRNVISKPPSPLADRMGYENWQGAGEEVGSVIEVCVYVGVHGTNDKPTYSLIPLILFIQHPAASSMR